MTERDVSAGMPLPRFYFQQDPVVCAKGLIGSYLVWRGCVGRVVETEAYAEFDDPACHTFFRKSARAFVDRHKAGTAYVYLNYGMHWMLNVLVKGLSRGFVLIRAVEPIAGIERMRKRRGVSDLPRLCSGPGKLAQAFGVTGEHHGLDLCKGVSRGFREGLPAEILADTRIGISVARELPWRFLLRGSKYLSRPASRLAGAASGGLDGLSFSGRTQEPGSPGVPEKIKGKAEADAGDEPSYEHLGDPL